MELNQTLLKESFDAIRVHSLDVFLHFLEEWIEIDPKRRAGLSDRKSIETTHKIVFANLNHGIELVNDPNAYFDFFKKWGVHFKTKLGLGDQDWPSIQKAILVTLQFYFDQQWTKELESNWVQFLESVVKVMKFSNENVKMDAQSTFSIQFTPEMKEYVQNIARKILAEAVEREMNENFKKKLNQQAEQLFKSAIEEEARRWFDSNSGAA